MWTPSPAFSLRRHRCWSCSQRTRLLSREPTLLSLHRKSAQTRFSALQRSWQHGGWPALSETWFSAQRRLTKTGPHGLTTGTLPGPVTVRTLRPCGFAEREAAPSHGGSSPPVSALTPSQGPTSLACARHGRSCRRRRSLASGLQSGGQMWLGGKVSSVGMKTGESGFHLPSQPQGQTGSVCADGASSSAQATTTKCPRRSGSETTGIYGSFMVIEAGGLRSEAGLLVHRHCPLAMPHTAEGRRGRSGVPL